MTRMIQQWHQTAQSRLNKGDLRGAHEHCLKILNASPEHADAWFLLGMIAATQGQISKAVQLVEKAIGFAPTQAEYHAHHVRCLVMLNHHAAALAAADSAVQCQPQNALTFDTLGVVYSRLGLHEKAVEVFKDAVKRTPTNPNYYYNLAASLKFLGDFSAANDAYETVIRLNPHFYKAHSALTDLGKITAQHNHIERLENLLQETTDVDGRLHLSHALYKEYESLHDYDKAFAYLASGNAQKRANLDYHIEHDQQLFDALETAFQSDRLPSENTGYPTQEPIFIIGMPRTGTTLVERILSSHSQVFSAGELQNFGLALKRITQTTSRQVLDVETINAGLHVDFQQLGKAYLESTRPLTGHTPRFIDKMPLNFFYAGFIRLALPNARIICLRRDPVDTCVSNFRQLFALNFSYYNYAFDLLDTGRYFLRFEQLIKHWMTVFPSQILEMSYEALVQNPEQETRRLLEYCGLPWEDACLAFHENTAPVATASAVQVRQPLYDSSVGRWRRYEKHLQPLLELLTTTR